MTAKFTLPCGRVVESSDTSHPDKAAKRYADQLAGYEVTRHLNRSSARNFILKVLLTMDRHFTALTLARKVQAKKSSVGPATVYRNLPVFVASGILRESLMDERGQILYELTTLHHHDHIVCTDCNQIIEFHDETIEKHQETIMSNLRFAEVSHHHVMYAQCELLKKRRRNHLRS